MLHWMTRLTIVGAILLGAAGMASAQEGGEVKEKFYNFDDMLIDGEFKTPEGMYENARNRAKFERSLKLKESFLDEIQETNEEDALDAE